MGVVKFDPSQTAKKPRKPKDSGGSGSGGGVSKEPALRFGSYAIIDGCFYQIYPAKDHEKQIRLCDFTCKIIEEITQDSGLEDSALLRIAVTRQDGRVFPVVDVPAAKFFNGSWVSEYYTTALFLSTGTTIKEQLRACVQLYSKLDCVDIPNRTVFKYCGWKKINEQWHYLTGTGGINAEGLQDSVNVDMGSGHISRYKLPAPVDREAIKATMPVIRDLLNICPDKQPIGAALLAAVARAPLGECSPIDFCIFVHGLTDSKKSSIVSIALACFGDFAGNVFPANWTDTSNDIEAKSFQVASALLVVDDFKPSVSLAEASKLHAMAERLIRNTGNGAGRGRRSADMSSKAAPYNRSLTLITGEDLPRGQSLLGRLLILELLRHDVDCAALTRLQQAARDAQLSGLMAAIEATFSVAAEPQGDCIGWYYEDLKLGVDRQVWLDQEAAFAKVQEFARKQGDTFLMSAATLWRRMGDKGLITQTENRPDGSKQWTVKRTVAGVKRRVMVLSAEQVENGS